MDGFGGYVSFDAPPAKTSGGYSQTGSGRYLKKD